MKTTSKLRPNSLVAYQGGGYDGCFWEWNYAVISESDEFHDVYSTGYAGVHDRENLEILLEKSREETFDIYDLSSKEERDRFADKESVANVLLVADYLQKALGIGITVKCDLCGERFDASGVTPGDYRGEGGVVYTPSSIYCLDCSLERDDDY